MAIPITIDTKLQIIQQLIDSGISRIQVASFVHPKLVPQMADAEELISRLVHSEDVLYSGLVLNEKGVHRAIDCGLGHLSCSMSASDTHSQKNARISLTDARTRIKYMISLAKSNGIQVRAGIQCAFGCRYEGHISKSVVMDLVKHHLDLGITEIALADSTGMAHPAQIKEYTEEIISLCEGIPVFLHLHNTESKGLANVYTAVTGGVRHFDTAFGGLGGCPFIKSATGNIATEDTVHMLHQMGYETGINNKKIASISIEMEERLGHTLQGQMYNLLHNEQIKIT